MLSFRPLFQFLANLLDGLVKLESNLDFLQCTFRHLPVLRIAEIHP